MAIPVVASLPWKEIIKVLPGVLSTAVGLWDRWSRQPQPAPIDPSADPRRQIQGLAARLENLERSEVEQAELITHIAEQLQGLSLGLNEVSRRSNLALVLAAVALTLAAVALGVVMLR